MSNERCPRCDREGCPRHAAEAMHRAAWRILTDYEDARGGANPNDPEWRRLGREDLAATAAAAATAAERAAEPDCAAHAVDWRQRVLAVEVQLAAARQIARERDEAQADRRDCIHEIERLHAFLHHINALARYFSWRDEGEDPRIELPRSSPAK